MTQFMNLSGFAQDILVNEHALTKIDTAMPLDRAALIGCGVLTGWGAVTRTSGFRAGETVAVIGCGAVGLSAVQAARLAGATEIIAIDPNANRRATAAMLGATNTFDPATCDPVEAVRQMTGGHGVHNSFEAVGVPALAKQAFLMTRKGGNAVLIGMMGLEQEISLPFGHFIADRSVKGCDMGSNQFPTDMNRLVRLYLDGRLNLDDMLTARLPLQKINEGFAAMDRGEGIRTIIDFSLS